MMWERIVRQMLGADEKYGVIPPELYRRVERVDKLVKLAGGGLVSRQAIAIIVENWQREGEDA